MSERGIWSDDNPEFPPDRIAESLGRDELVRQSMADFHARAALARQESIAQAFQRMLNAPRSQTDTRVHGVLHRKRVKPDEHQH